MSIVELKRLFLGTLLWVAAGCGSILIITEAAGYYARFYDHSWRGLAIAILAEVMLILMTTIPRPTNRWHPAGFLAVILAASIFVLTTLAAGLYIIQPVVMAMDQSERITKLEQALRAEIKDAQSDQIRFQKDGQRINAVVSSRRRAKARAQLVTLLKTPPSSAGRVPPWLQIWLLFALRVAIQLATVLTAWTASRINQRPPSTVPSTVTVNGGGKKQHHRRFTRQVIISANPLNTAVERSEQRTVETVDFYGDEPAIFPKKGQLRLPGGRLGKKAVLEVIKQDRMENRRQYLAVDKNGKQGLVRMKDGSPQAYQKQTWQTVPGLLSQVKELYKFKGES